MWVGSSETTQQPNLVLFSKEKTDFMLYEPVMVSRDHKGKVPVVFGKRKSFKYKVCAS